MTLFKQETLTSSLIASVLTSSPIIASEYPPRPIPSRNISVPTTVSEKMQEILAKPLGVFMSINPSTTEEWNQVIAETQLRVPEGIEKAQQISNTTYEAELINGVNTYTVMPSIISKENQEFLIIHIHGGAYVFFPKEGCIPEAMLIAGYSKCKTITIDYRMPPHHPFPAALDDVVAVYQDILKTYKPENIGLFGTSAGAGLATALTLKLQELQQPLPAAIVLGTPWSDLTETGDTYCTNKDIDNILISYESFASTAKLYANSHDLKNPLISPVYGTFDSNYRS